MRAFLLAALLSTAAQADSETKARQWFTDTVLVTQDDKPLRFYSDVLSDRVVVMNFIYTRCPGACPLITRQLNQVRQALGGDFGSKVFFVSISLDPEHDTPGKLKAFAQKNEAQFPGWTFLTGDKANVDEVVKRLGMYVEEPADHATTLIAGNAATRHWMKLRPDLPPTAIAAKLRQLVEGK